jgi:hypothetical protein
MSETTQATMDQVNDLLRRFVTFLPGFSDEMITGETMSLHKDIELDYDALLATVKALREELGHVPQEERARVEFWKGWIIDQQANGLFTAQSMTRKPGTTVDDCCPHDSFTFLTNEDKDALKRTIAEYEEAHDHVFERAYLQEVIADKERDIARANAILPQVRAELAALDAQSEDS